MEIQSKPKGNKNSLNKQMAVYSKMYYTFAHEIFPKSPLSKNIGENNIVHGVNSKAGG